MWLRIAYGLEFEGLPYHFRLWIASLLFLVVNVVIMIVLMRSFDKKRRDGTPVRFKKEGDGIASPGIRSYVSSSPTRLSPSKNSPLIERSIRLRVEVLGSDNE